MFSKRLEIIEPSRQIDFSLVSGTIDGFLRISTHLESEFVGHFVLLLFLMEAEAIACRIKTIDGRETKNS